jgi:hypothetical protein
MNSFCPASGSEGEWKEARVRLEAYLRALQLAHLEQQERVVVAVLRQAAIIHAQQPAESPTTIVMNKIQEASEQWIARVVGCGEHVSVSGFVSLFATDAAKKWPAAFLDAEIPPDFQDVLRESHVRAAPDLNISRMVPEPFANPLQDAITLSAPLAELAKNKAPLLARVFAVSLSWLSIWWGNKPR